MSDIVDRLRTECSPMLCYQAAEEIDRLRTQRENALMASWTIRAATIEECAQMCDVAPQYWDPERVAEALRAL